MNSSFKKNTNLTSNAIRKTTEITSVVAIVTFFPVQMGVSVRKIILEKKKNISHCHAH
jgi:hypothetical protein